MQQLENSVFYAQLVPDPIAAEEEALDGPTGAAGMISGNVNTVLSQGMPTPLIKLKEIKGSGLFP